MTRLSRIRVGFALAAVLAACLSNTPSAGGTPSEQGQGPGVPKRAGQSTTVLPDGRLLLIGGSEGARVQSDAFIVDPVTNRVTRLALALKRPRTGHTATVLSDGRVLVFGGLGADDNTVSAEIFDTSRLAFSDANVAIASRSNHSATLLTDGRVLLVGGREPHGGDLDTAVVWNPDDGSTKVLPLQSGRSNHEAELQRDGTVFIRAGSSEVDELFVPGADVMVVAGARQAVDSSADLVGTLPENGAVDVPVGTRLALRLSRELDPSSVRADTLRLTESGRTVDTVNTLAGNGRLVFVRPLHPLNAGSSYVLVVSGLASRDGNGIGSRSLSFTTASADAATPAVSADDVWRPESPGNWRTGAKRSPWQDLPALTAPDGVTALSGQVLRINGTPLADVDLRIGNQTARSDSSGRFLLRLDGVTTGRHVLEIDGVSSAPIR